MKLKNMLEGPIAEALRLLPERMNSTEAKVMLLAIGLQESRFEHRRQVIEKDIDGDGYKELVEEGPAKSFWQAEQGGGMVAGLLRFHDSRVRDIATALCAVRGVSPNTQSVWDAIEHDDVLAAGLARLLLWTDPKPLPAIGDVDGAWKLYARVWRPGKPHPQTWAKFYAEALEAVA